MFQRECQRRLSIHCTRIDFGAVVEQQLHKLQIATGRRFVNRAEILGSLEEAKALGRFRWVQPEPEFGPWRIPTQTQVGVVWRAPTKTRKPDDTPLRIGLPGVVEVTAADALFIANAREDMPKLISEIKRLRALLAKNSNGTRKPRP